VPTGYQLVGYANDSFTGTNWTFTADNGDLRNTGNNDAISSLRVTFNPSAYVRIANVTTGLVLDSGGSVASGSVLKQWGWDGSTNLQWRLNDLGNGRYQIINRGTNTALDGMGSGTAGSTACMWAPNTSTNNQWTI